MTTRYLWWNMDSKERYTKNVKDKSRRAKLESLGYLNCNLFYDLDKFEFRNTHAFEFNRESNIALGCSNTFGVGIQNEHTWPYLVEQTTGLPTFNLGVPGGSFETCFRILSTFLPTIQSKKVYMMCPPEARRDVNGRNLGHWWHPQDWTFLELLSKKEVIIARKRALYAIIALCARYGAELIILKVSPGRLSKGFAQARDLEHPGIFWNEQVAEAMLNGGQDIYGCIDES